MKNMKKLFCMLTLALLSLTLLAGCGSSGRKWRDTDVINDYGTITRDGKQIDVCVRLSGLTKQDYIVRRLMCRDIVVQGNPRVYKALKNQMAELYEELKRIEQFSEENEELLYTLQLVAETLNGMKEDED